MERQRKLHINSDHQQLSMGIVTVNINIEHRQPSIAKVTVNITIEHRQYGYSF